MHPGEYCTVCDYGAFAHYQHFPVDPAPRYELSLRDVGASRARVLQVLRRIQALSPTEASELLKSLPVIVARGHAEIIEKAARDLQDADCSVEIIQLTDRDDEAAR
jgi:ribosomal protein L7/L12